MVGEFKCGELCDEGFMACQDRGGGAGEEVAYELGFAVFDRGRDSCFGREDGETGGEGVGEECLAGTFGCCWLLLLLLCAVFGSRTFRHLLTDSSRFPSLVELAAGNRDVIGALCGVACSRKFLSFVFLITGQRPPRVDAQEQRIGRE